MNSRTFTLTTQIEVGFFFFWIEIDESCKNHKVRKLSVYDSPYMSPRWFMNLSVESNWFALNEVINLPYSGPQAYSYIVMEITELQNHNTIVTCQGWPWALFLWIWPCEWYVFCFMPLLWLCWFVKLFIPIWLMERLASERDTLFCRTMGTARLQKATDWNVHRKCFFWSEVSFFCTLHPDSTGSA